MTIIIIIAIVGFFVLNSKKQTTDQNTVVSDTKTTKNEIKTQSGLEVVADQLATPTKLSSNKSDLNPASKRTK